MADYILLISIIILLLFLGLGLIIGFVRGVKRSGLHIGFIIVSIVFAYLITKPITNAILGMSIDIDGETYTISSYIISLITSSFDLSGYDSVLSFLSNLPTAIIAPFVFLIIALASFCVFDLIYIIVARIAFGRKKKDFQNNRPHRWFGGLIGAFEGFLFLFILFAPLTSLTNTYEQLTTLSAQSAEVETISESEENKLQTISEIVAEAIPSSLHDTILAFNDSAIGKISSVFGFNNVLFDGLSSFKIDGEKITIRKEIISIASVYDDVVQVYNLVVDKNYTSIDLSTLKADLEEFIDNGFFKVVVTDTISTFVQNFDETTISLPEIVEDIVKELKDTFSDESLDVYEYLKHDILAVVDVAEDIFQNDLINQFSVDSNSVVNVLQVIEDNSTAVKDVAVGVLNLNILKDALPAVQNYASQKLEEMFENDKDLIVGINLEYDDADVFLDEIFDAINEIIELNDYVDISSLLSSEDIFSTISNIEDLDEAISKIGEVFDTVRDLTLFTLTEDDGTTIKVFDNILNIYNISLLGDEVVNFDGETITIDTYTKFFNFIKEPIKLASDIGLLDLITSSETDFDTVLDKLIEGLEENEKLLSEILLPFYQLKNASFDTSNTEVSNLKEMVFDEVIDILENNIEQIDLSQAKEIDTLENWDNELDSLTEVLLSLNNGSVETTSGEEVTYLKYLISDEFDMETLLKSMVENEDLADILESVFSANMFSPLVQDIFEQIDQQIEEFTKIDPNTDLTNLSATQSETIEAIVSLLEIILDEDELDEDGLSISQFGKVLDILKENAYNDGQEDGVFSNAYATIIYYLTGDNINDGNYSSESLYKNYEDVKNYLGLSIDEYYAEETSFTEIMQELEYVLQFANALIENITNKITAPIDLSDPLEYSKFMVGLNAALDEIDDSADKATVVNNMIKLVETSEDKYVFIDNVETYQEEIVNIVNAITYDDAELADALLRLLGVDTSSQE